VTAVGITAVSSASRPGGLLGTADLWRREVGRARVGCLAVALFAAALACYLAVLALADARVGSWHDLRQPAWTWLQGFLPLVCGFGVATVATPGQTVELHLSLPTSLRATLARRLALVAGPSLVLALAGWLLADPAGLWGESYASTLLEIVAPLLLYAAVAALCAALSGSTRAAAAAVVVAWVAELLLRKSDEVLLVIAAPMLVAAWLVLRSDEHLLRTGDLP
jgi:hypothetical protein